MQFAVGFAQLNVAAEVAFGPRREHWRQIGQHPCQLALQGVDQQRNQQDQANHQALHEPHFVLNLPVLGADHRLQLGNGVLHRVEFAVRGGTQLGALFDLRLGAFKLGRVAAQEVVQLTLEVDPGIFGLGALVGFEAHHCGEIVIARSAFAADAEQGQGVDELCLGLDAGQFALYVTAQLTAPAADQFVAVQRQLGQVQRGGHQRR